MAVKKLSAQLTARDSVASDLDLVPPNIETIYQSNGNIVVQAVGVGPNAIAYFKDISPTGQAFIYEINGDNDQIVFPVSDALSFGSNAFTVEAWVQANTISQHVTFLSESVSGTNGGVADFVSIGAYNNGRVYASFGNKWTGTGETGTLSLAVPASKNMLFVNTLYGNYGTHAGSHPNLVKIAGGTGTSFWDARAIGVASFSQYVNNAAMGGDPLPGTSKSAQVLCGYGIYGNVTITTGQWNHVAVSRSEGGDTRLYVNGFYAGNCNTDGVFVNASNLRIGTHFQGGNLLHRHVGSISQVRMIKGESLYESNTYGETLFVPPSRLDATANTVFLLAGADSNDSSSTGLVAEVLGNVTATNVALPLPNTTSNLVTYVGQQINGRLQTEKLSSDNRTLVLSGNASYAGKTVVVFLHDPDTGFSTKSTANITL